MGDALFSFGAASFAAVVREGGGVFRVALAARPVRF
jgi:hypothetical protein